MKRHTKLFRSTQGFTLLEILVVLTIMGFLIAMVAPRLAGISGDAVDTVCDTNQNRMVTYMSSYFEKTNRLPNDLTNLVIVDGTDTDPTANTYQIPVVSDQDPDNGAEVLANEFYARNHFHIHVLNEYEAAELKSMGVVEVFNLNDYSGLDTYITSTTPLEDFDNDVQLADVTDQAPTMDPVTIAEGVGVSMVGCGAPVETADDFVLNSDATENDTERGWGEPDWFGRIVLGMGPECGLITTGIIGNAAHCPGGIQNADNVTYNDYNLTLPRLSSTVTRMQNTTDFDAMDGDSTADNGIQVYAVAYDDEPTDDYDHVANDDNYRARSFTIDEAQEAWQYATQCPEGHSYPEDDGEFWGIDFNPTAGVGGPTAGQINE